VKFAILLSCILGAGFITVYSTVMNQVKDLENFYGNIDQYAQTAVSGNNSVNSPYIPQPLIDASQPLNNTPLQK
jgi:hypothetical protein